MEWTIAEKYQGMLLRDFLRMEQSFSRRTLKSIIHDGGKIQINGIEKTVRYSLQTGDVLTIQFPMEPKGVYMKPEEIPLNIVYEDASVLVINKPAGMATIPSTHHPGGTIANGVLAHYEKEGIPYTVHVVTRLDRDTSGLLLIAKNRYIHSILSESQKQSEVKRHYLAIVEGVPEPRSGTIDAPIGRKEDSIIERMVRIDGQTAITHFKMLETNEKVSLMDVSLQTGRTHQIRVHFSHIGHPLAGDDLYGGSTQCIKRQALHCYQLTFEHPTTKESLTFHSPLPTDMDKILSH